MYQAVLAAAALLPRLKICQIGPWVGSRASISADVVSVFLKASNVVRKIMTMPAALCALLMCFFREGTNSRWKQNIVFVKNKFQNSHFKSAECTGWSTQIYNLYA